MPRPAGFPLGAEITLAHLDRDPHPWLARLREREPVSWLPAIEGWLVTGYDLALEVMRDASTFTVDDPRFSTARVIGPSMLSLDGDEHTRHRAPFVAPFRPAQVRDRFTAAVAEEAHALIDVLAPAGCGELRRSFAGPLAAAIIARALGLQRADVPTLLERYDAIVAAVTAITAGAGAPSEGHRGFAALSALLYDVIAGDDRSSLLAIAATRSELTVEQVTANAAVLLFGGIETTEGMIANAALMLLERPAVLEQVRRQPRLLDAAIEESLRLEPAAAVIDRYATRRSRLAGAEIAQGQLVRVSISAANRDPAVFEHPDRFNPTRPRAAAGRHVAFAHGPHVCVGVHLARLEARAGLAALLSRLPDLRLDPRRPAAISGLVFRKPHELHALWGPADAAQPTR